MIILIEKIGNTFSNLHQGFKCGRACSAYPFEIDFYNFDFGMWNSFRCSKKCILTT